MCEMTEKTNAFGCIISSEHPQHEIICALCSGQAIPISCYQLQTPHFKELG